MQLSTLQSKNLYPVKALRLLHAIIFSCLCICTNAQVLNWNTVSYSPGTLNPNFGILGNPGVSVSLNITGYTAGLPSSSPAKRRVTPDAGSGTTCTAPCALRSAPVFSNPATQSLVLTFTFSPAVTPLSFPIYDIDGIGSVVDSIRITASGPTGAQVVTAANVNPASSNIYGSGTASVIVKGGNGTNTDAQTNISVSGYVTTLVLTFMGQGTFSVGNMLWYGILPVKPISFSANKTNAGFVDLKWMTENEEQNDHYLIERSKDGLQFMEIGKITPGKESRNNYYFTDKKPEPGNLYYRIARVEIDGRREYSKTIAVTQNETAKYTLTVTPNPSSDYIHLNSAVNDQLKKVEIYNAMGKSMYNPLQANSHIYIGFLSAGLYYLKAESTDGKLFSAKFLKQ